MGPFLDLEMTWVKSALHNKSSKTLYIKNLTWNLNSFGEENPINLMVLQVVYDLVITGTVLSNLQTLLDLNLNNLNPQESFFACVCADHSFVFSSLHKRGCIPHCALSQQSIEGDYRQHRWWAKGATFSHKSPLCCPKSGANVSMSTGLQYVWEFRSPSRSVQPHYQCKLCSLCRLQHDMIDHVKGWKHCFRYLVSKSDFQICNEERFLFFSLLYNMLVFSCRKRPTPTR